MSLWKLTFRNDHLQVIRYSSLSRLRGLILTALYVSVLALKGLRSQTPSQDHLFAFFKLWKREIKFRAILHELYHPESKNIYADCHNQFFTNETNHIVLICDCNNVFSFYFIEVIIFAGLLDAYTHSE